MQTIDFTIEPPEDFKQMQSLYESLGWNAINLTIGELEELCIRSWCTIYAFDGERLVGTGRVISDGVITGIICGLGVLPRYQRKSIGKEILTRLIQHCESNRVIPQLLCEEHLESYYESFGFKKFAIGMSRKINR